jgi:hypothetical protein
VLVATDEKLTITHCDGADDLLAQRIGGDEFKLRADFVHKAVAPLVRGIAQAIGTED